MDKLLKEMQRKMREEYKRRLIRNAKVCFLVAAVILLVIYAFLG